MEGRPLSEFKVDTLPYTKTRIIMGGLEIPAELKKKETKSGFSFLPVIHGEESDMDIEEYRSDSSGLQLLMAGGEAYVPPILLVGPLVTPGATWEWKGETVLTQNGVQLNAPNSRQHASATVGLASEALNEAGGPYDTVKINVALSINDGSPAPSKRTLLFWIAPGKGIIKRDFAVSSTRLPAPPEK